MTHDEGATAAATGGRGCQWCGTAARADATHCARCGAALPLAASLDGLVIPGVTEIDPELAAYRDKPLRIPRASTSQYVAGPAFSAAAADPIGILGLGALAAVAATELAGARRGRPADEIDRARLGVPSPPVLDVARRLQQSEAGTDPETGSD